MSPDSSGIQKSRYDFNSVHYNLMHKNSNYISQAWEKLFACVIERERERENCCGGRTIAVVTNGAGAHFAKPQKARLIGKLWQPESKLSHSRTHTRECEEACGAAHIAHGRKTNEFLALRASTRVVQLSSQAFAAKRARLGSAAAEIAARINLMRCCHAEVAKVQG